MADVTIPSEFDKRLGVVSTPLDIENVPNDLKALWTAHPTTGPAAAAKFNEYIHMGFRPVKPRPQDNAFDIGVTMDYNKMAQDPNKYMFIAAFSVDNAGYVTTPGKDAILLVAKKEIVEKVREQLTSYTTKMLQSQMGSGKTPDGRVFAARSVETGPDEAKRAATELAAEAEADEQRLLKREVNSNG